MKAIPNVSRMRYLAHNPTSRLFKIVFDKLRAYCRLNRIKH